MSRKDFELIARTILDLNLELDANSRKIVATNIAMAQDWTPGQRVKVGFLTLQVLAKIPTPGDWLPDAYVLRSGNRFYRFIPHNGLHRFTTLEDAVRG